MEQLRFGFGGEERPAPKRPGPPNRMNDLSYKDWMKFQKSFFRHRSSQALVEECICFFTKAVWPDGEPSRCLIIGFADIDPSRIPAPRLVDAHNRCDSFDGVARLLLEAEQAGLTYDFIFIDLRRLIVDEESLNDVPHRLCGRRFTGAAAAAGTQALLRTRRGRPRTGRGRVSPALVGSGGIPPPPAAAG